jgi:hypothetical protein
LVSRLPRDWTPRERELIEQTQGRLPHTRKLTDDQIKEIRRRVDSMTVPWTTAELAEQYNVTPEAIRLIAKRERWTERTHEPDGQQWWKAREIEEMLGDE